MNSQDRLEFEELRLRQRALQKELQDLNAQVERFALRLEPSESIASPSVGEIRAMEIAPLSISSIHSTLSADEPAAQNTDADLGVAPVEAPSGARRERPHDPAFVQPPAVAETKLTLGPPSPKRREELRAVTSNVPPLLTPPRVANSSSSS
jgi:hypothetical protein